MLKVIGIILLVIMLLIVILFIAASNQKAVSKDYMEKVTTRGDIEAKYIKNGDYEVSYIEIEAIQNFKKYEIYYPSNIEKENKKCLSSNLCDDIPETVNKVMLRRNNAEILNNTL